MLAPVHAVFRHAPDRGRGGCGVEVDEHLLVLGDRSETRILVLRGFHGNSQATAMIDLGGRVHDDKPSKFFRVPAAVEHGDAAAQGMTDDHESIDVQGFDNGLDVLHVILVRVGAVGMPIGIAMAAKVQGHDPVMGGHRGNEIVPDMRFVAVAVKEQHGHSLLTPLDQVEGEPVGPPKLSFAAFHPGSVPEHGPPARWRNGRLRGRGSRTCPAETESPPRRLS